MHSWYRESLTNVKEKLFFWGIARRRKHWLKDWNYDVNRNLWTRSSRYATTARCKYIFCTRMRSTMQVPLFTSGSEKTVFAKRNFYTTTKTVGRFKSPSTMFSANFSYMIGKRRICFSAHETKQNLFRLIPLLFTEFRWKCNYYHMSQKQTHCSCFGQ